MAVRTIIPVDRTEIPVDRTEIPSDRAAAAGMIENPEFWTPAACWHFDETSGNAVDRVTSLVLTATSAPGTQTGLLGNARSFVRSTPSYFTRADEAVMSMGDIAFCFSLWWQNKTQTGTAGDFAIINKYLSSATNRGYKLASASSLAVLQLSNDGTNAAGSFISLTGPAIVNDVWTHYVFGYDKNRGLARLIVNTVGYETAHTGGAFDNTPAFEVARGGASSLAADGYIDELVCWKNYFPTEAEIALLYNGGAGFRMPL